MSYGEENPTKEANEKANEKRAQKSLDLIRAYKNVFNSPEGQTVLFDLMKSCSFLKATYYSGVDSMQINEGRRSVILDILGVLDRKEEDIIKFLHQSNAKQEEYES